jgi:hypothetical protein
MRSEARGAPRQRARRIALAACFALGLGAARARAEVIERIVAVVDGRPLLLSEVRLLERLRGLPARPALEALIDEALMFRESTRLPATLSTAEEEERAYASLLERLGAPAGALEDGLRRLARRETAILKYVAFRFGPQVRVTDEALKAAYQAEHADDAQAPPFEAVAGSLRERLQRDQLDRKVEAWIRELRESAEIRYNPDSGGAAP